MYDRAWCKRKVISLVCAPIYEMDFGWGLWIVGKRDCGFMCPLLLCAKPIEGLCRHNVSRHPVWAKTPVGMDGDLLQGSNFGRPYHGTLNLNIFDSEHYIHWWTGSLMFALILLIK